MEDYKFIYQDHLAQPELHHSPSEQSILPSET